MLCAVHAASPRSTRSGPMVPTSGTTAAAPAGPPARDGVTLHPVRPGGLTEPGGRRGLPPVPPDPPATRIPVQTPNRGPGRVVESASSGSTTRSARERVGDDQRGVDVVDPRHPGLGLGRRLAERHVASHQPRPAHVVGDVEEPHLVELRPHRPPLRTVEQQVVALGDHELGLGRDRRSRPRAAARGRARSRAPRRSRVAVRTRRSSAAYPQASKVSGAPLRSSRPSRRRATSARWKPSIGRYAAGHPRADSAHQPLGVRRLAGAGRSGDADEYDAPT